MIGPMQGPMKTVPEKSAIGLPRSAESKRSEMMPPMTVMHDEAQKPAIARPMLSVATFFANAEGNVKMQ
jgi:hypothetical protein